MNSSNSNGSDSNNNGMSNGIDVSTRDLALHFLDRARLAAVGGPSDMDEDEEAPTELNTFNSSGGFLVVSPDKLSLKYTAVNLHGHDVGVVQSNKPAPVKRLVYYFEIFVKDGGSKNQVAIGFTNENFKMRRQPGWEVNSFGYHGDDGCIYRGQAKGDAFGPTYTTGDTVGGGINYSSQEFFFTKNGAIVGTPVYKDVKGPLFPTVAVHSQNEEVEVNFGQRPFLFDVKDYEAQERMKQQIKIDQICVPPNVSHGLVRLYLLHYGYEETLNAFDMASESTVPEVSVGQENGFDEQKIVYALNERKTLRQFIRSGQIEMAFSKLRDWYPQIVQDDKSAFCFLLHCQHFIELVRVGRLDEAVRYGRIELAKFFGMTGFEDFVKECVALLAYEQPQESPVGYLLKESQREVVADTVNAMVLSTNPSMNDHRDCLHSYLERLLRQLSACCLERRSVNGDQGEAFHLHQVLERTKC